MFSCYTTVYIYYMFIVFTEATYLMTDEPPYYTCIIDSHVKKWVCI